MSLGHNGVLISQSTLVGSKAKGLMRQRFLPDLQLGRNPERGKLMEQQLLNWCEMHWSYMRKGAFFLSQKTRKALNLMKKWLTRTLSSRKICEELSNAWFLTSYCAQMSQKAESTLLKWPSKGTQKDIYDLKATPSSVPKLSITNIALIL